MEVIDDNVDEEVINEFDDNNTSYDEHLAEIVNNLPLTKVLGSEYDDYSKIVEETNSLLDNNADLSKKILEVNTLIERRKEEILDSARSKYDNASIENERLLNEFNSLINNPSANVEKEEFLEDRIDN